MSCCSCAPAIINFESKELESGPLRKRACTDCICILLFAFFCCGLVVIAVFSYRWGDPYRLVFGVDVYGNACGRRDNENIANVSFSGRNLSTKRRLFYFDADEMWEPFISNPYICVEECPIEDLNTIDDIKKLATRKIDPINLCLYHVNFSVKGFENLCPKPPIPKQISILHRCMYMPKAISLTVGTLKNATSKQLNTLLMKNENLTGIYGEKTTRICHDNTDFVETLARDLQLTWEIIIYSLILSLAMSFVFIILMRVLACLVIWGMLIMVICISIGISVYCWLEYRTAKSKYDALPELFRTYYQFSVTFGFAIVAGIFSAFAVILILLAIFLRKRIRLTVAIFEEASKTITKIPLLFIQPIWTCIALIFTTSALAICNIYLESAGYPMVNPTNGHVQYVKDNFLKYAKYYHVFGFFWVTFFVLACHMMVIAGTTATYYFVRDKKKVGRCMPVFSSTKRLIRYHLGTVLFGSAIIALLKFLRWLIKSIEKRGSKMNNSVGKFILKACRCCIWCLQKCMNMISTNAYIMTAVFGCNFCQGCRRSIVLLLSNILRLATITAITTFILTISKIGIAFLTGLAAIEWLEWKYNHQVCYLGVVLLVNGVAALLLCHVFLSVYGSIIDTIFLSFCVDCDVNNGVDRPYFMSTRLMIFVSNADEATRQRNISETPKSEEQRGNATDNA